MKEEGIDQINARPVKLILGNNGYFSRDFVQRCEDELRLKHMLVVTGIDSINALESLAVMILTDSAEYHGVDPGNLATSVNLPKEEL